MHRSPIPIPKVVGPKAQCFTLCIPTVRPSSTIFCQVDCQQPRVIPNPIGCLFIGCPSVDDIVLLSAFCHGLQKLVNIL